MFYVVLDTETTNGFDSPLTYDIGWCVIDEDGNVFEKRSFVVNEIFFNDALMESAYFKDKIPSYLEGLSKLKRKNISLITIKEILKDDCRKYCVKAIVAHNARFDYSACQNTIRYITDSRCRFFFPYGIELFDTLKMAREVFGKDADYLNFCTKHDYFTETSLPKMTAEILYRYLHKDEEFIESHTGLEDTLIEKDIFVECTKRGAENCKLFEPQYIEMFNGRDMYFVEKTSAIIGTEIDGRSIIYKLDDIPVGMWIKNKDGTFFKKAEEVQKIA